MLALGGFRIQSRPYAPKTMIKPAKPTPDFPLFPHATKRWAKKIRGRMVYFGRWDDPAGALALYESQKLALYAGERPETPALTPAGPVTVRVLAAMFLAFKESRLDRGSLSSFTFADYAEACQVALESLGRHSIVEQLKPADFARLLRDMERRWGPVRVGNVVGRVKSIFRWGKLEGHIANEPPYGAAFKKPSRREVRLQRAASGPKLFSAGDIQKLLSAASQPVKSMILLGINAGFGNSDIGSLPIASLGLDRGWIEFPRPKTGIARRCPLWPETVAALREWIALRPATDDGEIVFVTRRGFSWAKRKADSPVSKEFRKLADRLKLPGSFYWLRHTFQTAADGSRDFVAVRLIMGHVGSDIADEYRERIEDERLLAVTSYVRKWLFAAHNG